jgi:nitroimidazol reductase NimA-like FMN-containing flavoprotein (pyridoxamine 5'-phosphate oxidase superfamily)
MGFSPSFVINSIRTILKGGLAMREMTEKEIRDFIEEWTWGTIIAVDGDKPYAIEIAYGSDEKHIYFGSRPNGKMAKCIRENQNIIFKICDADKFYPTWRAVSVFGKAERLTKREDILHGVKSLGEKAIHNAKKTSVTEKQFEAVGEKLAANPEAGGPLRIAIENFSGMTRPQPSNISSQAAM